jgi:virulence factor Mce-like protein
MRRIVAICVLALAAGAIAVLGTGAGEDSSASYVVRAEFRNAFSVIPGEDVKIAGVKVGKIKSLDVTPQKTAAVALDITRKGFQDFRSDAECTIRPQSLIGEKFVECTPTQPRQPGALQAPPLQKIRSGAGKGQYRLPVTNTARPVDIDLVANVMRLPYRQRLSIILNEFGAGLAGRGEDLRNVIRNADPGLKQTDRVLEILGSQNKVLGKLARDSDTILAPLAREREHVAGFVANAATTAQAAAERRTDLERNIQKLPEFLRQLKPTMQRLGALSDEMTPVLSDLGSVAPSINRFILQLGPFSRAATPSLKSLGDASVVGRKALVKSAPIVKDLRTFATTAKPLAQNLDALTASLKDTGGIERALDYLFYQAAAVNGFDSFGHYLRAILVVNLCSTYATKPDPACAANFVKEGSTNRSAAAALAAKDEGRSPALAREDAVLRGLSVDEALGRTKRAEHRKGSRTGGADAPLQLPTQFLPGQAAPAAPSSGDGGAAAPAPAPAAPAQPNAVKALLDYLLGSGS